MKAPGSAEPAAGLGSAPWRQSMMALTDGGGRSCGGEDAAAGGGNKGGPGRQGGERGMGTQHGGTASSINLPLQESN